MLRVTGVALLFRAWTKFDGLLPTIWDTLRPTLETRDFESAADQVRERAVRLVESLAWVGDSASPRLGESQRYQLLGMLDLHHYVTPKLLLVAAVANLTLEGQSGRQDATAVELIERGAPFAMHAYELEREDDPDDERVRAIYAEVRRASNADAVEHVYRALALWPDHFESAWRRLRKFMATESYGVCSERLRTEARALASELPFRAALRPCPALLAARNEIASLTSRFEQALAAVTLNVATMELEWRTPEEVSRSPFPARARPRAGTR